MNKAIAGYHLLMILSAVDDNFNGREDRIIRDYLAESFPAKVNLDAEMEILSTLNKDDYPLHFDRAMWDFYSDSTPEDRTHFLDMAVKLVAADKKVSPQEDAYLNELYNSWEANYTF
jgi:hypothetical protein